MSIVLQSASGGGRGQHATCNTHMAVRNGLMADLGGLAESHHDYYAKQDICVGRTLCSKLTLEASNSYKETYPKLMFEMLETYKSHLRLRDNNNPQNMAKFIEQKGISRSVSTIAGLDTFFEPCYLSHDSIRPSANAQFNEVRVRNFIIRLGETPSIESALRICPVRYGNFGGDENEDPHVHDYIMTPPIPEKSSSRDGFKKFLVDKNTEDNGDQYEKHQVDPALCADPEFDLHAAAVTASSFLQVVYICVELLFMCTALVYVHSFCLYVQFLFMCTALVYVYSFGLCVHFLFMCIFCLYVQFLFMCTVLSIRPLLKSQQLRFHWGCGGRGQKQRNASMAPSPQYSRVATRVQERPFFL